MGASPYLVVTAKDEGNAALSVSAVKLKPSSATSTPLGPEKTPHLSLSGLSPGKYELCISVTGHPELVFPVTLVKEATGLVPRFTATAPLCCPSILASSETSGATTKQLHTFQIGRAHV